METTKTLNPKPLYNPKEGGLRAEASKGLRV